MHLAEVNENPLERRETNSNARTFWWQSLLALTGDCTTLNQNYYKHLQQSINMSALCGRVYVQPRHPSCCVIHFTIGTPWTRHYMRFWGITVRHHGLDSSLILQVATGPRQQVMAQRCAISNYHRDVVRSWKIDQTGTLIVPYSFDNALLLPSIRLDSVMGKLEKSTSTERHMPA